MKNKLYNLIIDSAYRALERQNRDDSMPSGHNGPYLDEETPARNTGHWIITFLKVYEITGDKKFLDAARKGTAFLSSKQACPKDATFYHRKNPKKDFCNGLIGQAWSIESLSVSSKYFKEVFNLAKTVFLKHPFNEKTGLWERVEIDGKNKGVDETFNHQLWFAAAGGLLAGQDRDISRIVEIFMDKMPDNLQLYQSGLIVHNVKARTFKGMAKRILSKKNNKETVSKAIGYHQFNLYAFALLKRCYPGHFFWNSEKFQKLLKFIECDDFKKGLENNKYGFDYNAAGIETAYALSVLKENSENLQKYWLEKQFQRNYDFNGKMLHRNTSDPETLSARIYEATRLPDLTIDV